MATRYVMRTFCCIALAASSVFAGPPAPPASPAPPSPAPPVASPSLSPAPGAASTSEKLDAEKVHAEKKINDAFDATATLHNAPVTADLLQIVGQVIVDRATQQGWTILRDKLESSLDCNKPATRYGATCNVLATVRIQDLIASPSMLLEAAISDFTKIWQNELKPKVVDSKPLKIVFEMTVGATSIAALWSPTRKANAFGLGAEKVRELLIQQAGATCPHDDTNLPIDLTHARAAWGVAMCIVTSAEPTMKGKLDKCDLAMTMKDCGATDSDTMAAANLLRFALISPDPLDAAEGLVSFVTKGASSRIAKTHQKDAACYATDDKSRTRNLCANLIDDFGTFAIGLIRQDWNKVAGGGVGALDDWGKIPGNASIAGRRFFKLLSAIGQYALTYTKPTDPSAATDNAAKARREIIENLVREMTNRDDRSGWIVSVGGSLGLGGVYRHAIHGDANDSALPFFLPIGVGLQYYPNGHNCGFHAQFAAIDLGQYVSFDSDHDLNVGQPDPKSAVVVAAAAGLWFGSRSTPMWIGPYGGFAPFLYKDGKPAYFIGGMLGVYVPLLDF